MFPLSCTRVRAHTGHETSAHKKTCSAYKMFLPKMILHIFLTLHYTYRLILVRCCTKEILCAQRLEKIRGNIGRDPQILDWGVVGVSENDYSLFCTKSIKSILENGLKRQIGQEYRSKWYKLQIYHF